MKKTKRVLSLVVALIMLIGMLAGCADTSAPTDPSSPASSQPSGGGQGQTGPVGDDVKYKEEITMILITGFATINRFLPGSSSNTMLWCYNVMLDHLVHEVDGEYIPWLATEWHTDDWKVFTFKLRDDVYFHNGEHLTADDVVFTFEYAAEAVGSDPYDNIGRDLEKIEAISDFEVKITLKEVNVDYLSNLDAASSGIANRKACEADLESGSMIGTGPWAVESFISGESIGFARNDNYWGELPKTKKLTFLYVAEQSARIIMLENREVELAWETNFFSDYPYIESSDQFEAFSVVANNPVYLAFNMNDPICGDINFRKAIASVLDRETYAAVSRSGYAIPVTNGTFWGYETEFADDSIPLIPYDLEKAEEYLALSPYNGEEIVLTCALPNCVSDAQLLQEELKKIGVNIKVNQTDIVGLASAATYSNNTTQMIIHTGNWNVAANTVKSFYYPGAALNRASYLNTEIAELLDTSGSIVDKAERESVYKEIQQLAAEDIPFIGLYYLRHICGGLKGVGGLDLRANMSHRLAYVYMIEE